MSILRLSSSDGQVFEVEESAARQNQILADLIEDLGPVATVVPLPNVSASILAKVLDFCRYHESDSVRTASEVKSWDQAFIKAARHELHDVMLAAHYLRNARLMDLTARTVARELAGKSIEEMRLLLGIQSDFTPEEEQAIRSTNAWAFE